MKENYRDIFKRHFDGHEDDIDPQLVWDNIKPKKKNKKFFWFIFSSLLILLISTVIYFYSWNEKDELQASEMQMTELATNEKEEIHSIKLEKLNRDTKSKDQNNKNSLKSNKTNSKKININPNSQIPSSVAEQTFTEVKRNKEAERISYRHNKKADVKLVEQDEILNKQVVTEIESRSNKESIESPDIKKAIIKISYLENLYISSLSYDNRVIPNLYIDVEEYLTEEIVNSDNKEIDKKISLAVNGAYGFLQSNSTAKNSNNEQALVNRKNTVQELESARINMLVNYHLGSRISVSSGLQYSRINELFTWQGIYERESKGQYITEIVETAENTLITYAEGEFDERVDRNMRIYNKTNLVSIPLILNLHQGVGNFTFSIGGGVEANVFQWRDGFVLDNDNAPIALQDQEQSKFGINYVAKLGVEYSLNQQLSLAANFGYTKMKHSDSDLISNYRINDLGIGLRYFMDK